MSLAHPRPLRPHASSPLPDSTTSSASESLNSATQQSVSIPSEEAAPAVEKTGYPPQPHLVKPQQAEKENSPSSSSAPGGSSARPPHSPLTTNRRAFSAPYPQPLYIRPVSVAGPEGAAVAEEPEEEGRTEERVGGAWDREAVDELREIFSSTSVSPAATTTTTTTTSSSSSFVGTTVLLPPRPPSSANGAHHHYPSSSSSSSFPLPYPCPPRTPSRATGRSSSSRNGHARRRSSASAGSASASSPAASATTARGSELGSLVSGMGVLRVKTPVRVVGWDGEYYSPPSRALTRNPFASLSHTHSHTPTTSFPPPPGSGGLGALSQQLRKLHTHSAYPVMMEHAQGQVHEGAEGERHEEGEERGKEVSA